MTVLIIVNVQHSCKIFITKLSRWRVISKGILFIGALCVLSLTITHFLGQNSL